MDQTEEHIKRNIEETRAAMSNKIEKIEDRVHETVEGTKTTIDNIVGNINRVKGGIDETKSAIDSSIEAIKSAVDEAVERVKYTADLIEQVKQNPWVMFGTAVMVGYVMGSLNREESSGMQRTHQPIKESSAPERPASAQVRF